MRLKLFQRYIALFNYFEISNKQIEYFTSLFLSSSICLRWEICSSCSLLMLRSSLSLLSTMANVLVLFLTSVKAFTFSFFSEAPFPKSFFCSAEKPATFLASFFKSCANKSEGIINLVAAAEEDLGLRSMNFLTMVVKVGSTLAVWEGLVLTMAREEVGLVLGLLNSWEEEGSEKWEEVEERES